VHHQRASAQDLLTGPQNAQLAAPPAPPVTPAGGQGASEGAVQEIGNGGAPVPGLQEVGGDARHFRRHHRAQAAGIGEGVALHVVHAEGEAGKGVRLPDDL
jgi:hypothetical protein